jgi:hypothetical protein
MFSELPATGAALVNPPFSSFVRVWCMRLRKLGRARLRGPAASLAHAPFFLLRNYILLPGGKGEPASKLLCADAAYAASWWAASTYYDLLALQPQQLDINGLAHNCALLHVHQ